MEKLSVIIPCYNVEDYIDQTIGSLLNQTYRDFTILCLDDCSGDNTYEKLQYLSEMDSRIKVYRNNENLGVIRTLNKLIELSNSEWLIRMDSDDIFEPSRVEKLFKKIENEKLDIVSTSYSYIDFNGKEIKQNRELYLCTLNKSIKYMALLNSPFPSQALFHHSVFEREVFDNEFKVAEDYFFFTKVIKNRDIKVANLPEKLYRYRINPNGLTNTNALLMRKNHYEIAKRYARDILGVEAEEMKFLEITLKLGDFRQHKSKAIAQIIKCLFTLKQRFCLEFLPDKNELKEINLYTEQYFIYLLYTLLNSSLDLRKKIGVVIIILPYIIRNFNIKTATWLIKNK